MERPKVMIGIYFGAGEIGSTFLSTLTTFEMDKKSATFATTTRLSLSRQRGFENTTSPQNMPSQLCKKDNLVRNLKKMKRQLEKEGRADEAAKYDFLPTSFVLPRDYHMFLETFRGEADGTPWIMKPCSGAQGRGIFIFRRLRDIADWKKSAALPRRPSDGGPPAVESYVVQKYVAAPYLIGGKKFDTRIYVLVTSFRPLEAWLHREGFARFSHAVYRKDDISDTYGHLTNVAIAKTAPDYDPDSGAKWSLLHLRHFLLSRHGTEAVTASMEALGWLLVRTLRCVAAQMIQDPHCFELFGFDVLFDAQLRPWLIEVNASPSLQASSDEDRRLKHRVLNAVLDVLDLTGSRTKNESQVGGFDVFLREGKEVCYGADLGAQNPFASLLNVHLGAAYEDFHPGTSAIS